MVPFTAKIKWNRGWRRLRHRGKSPGLQLEDKAFDAYWEKIREYLKICGVDKCPFPVLKANARDWYHHILSSPRFFSAPMVLQSERAFRLLVRRYGIHVCYTPMILAQALVMEGFDEVPLARELLTPCPEDRPIIAQLAGCDEDMMVKAALMLQPYVDAIDVNMGCPQKCAELGCYGAYLDEHSALSIIQALSSKVKVPITCKIRAQGSIEETVRLAQKLEKAGILLITVHARQVQQRDHQGPADFDVIKAVQAAVTIPVIANGNCRRLQDAVDCMAYTKCSGFMSAVGLLRNPTLFSGEDVELTISGTLVDPHVAIGIVSEYLSLASLHPPPEARCIRDHLQSLLQEQIQFLHSELWALLGNDYVYAVPQYRAILIVLESHYPSSTGPKAPPEVPTLRGIRRMLMPSVDELDDLSFDLFQIEEEG